MLLEGKSLLITGAAGNLGRATAARAAAEGARLILVDRDQEGLRRAFAGLGTAKIEAALELQDDAGMTDLVARARGEFGRIDALCNIAGGFDMGPAVHETPPALLERMLDLNVRSLLAASRAVVPGMIAAGSGRIVNIGAIAALKAGARMGAYSAAKSAVVRLTESMSGELKQYGINVNCVLPSTLDTPANRESMPDADPSLWVAPDALADVILFLASDKARALHGIAVPVTGLS
jgi:NAD(P)-dependent dehydrogenase (short-subunit alcohol dehydrogenase family)